MPAVPLSGQKQPSGSAIYDAATVYVLEFCTVLALRNEETVKLLAADVAEALQNILRQVTSYHHVMISRTIFYLLSVLEASYVRTMLFVRSNQY